MIYSKRQKHIIRLPQVDLTAFYLNRNDSIVYNTMITHAPPPGVDCHCGSRGSSYVWDGMNMKRGDLKEKAVCASLIFFSEG